MDFWLFYLTRPDRYRNRCTAKARTGECYQLQPFCMKDEGRLLGVGLQEQASNHLKLLWSRSAVSVKEKA